MLSNGTDKKLFNTVRISIDTIEWVNDADFDPEVLISPVIRHPEGIGPQQT